jgi:hypothetical protein
MKVNDHSTPKEEILTQMAEPRPLPMGREQFEEWSDRIISGAIVTADIPSQKFVLANELISLGPTESHKCDAHFIHRLRKLAINETAIAVRDELYKARKAKDDAEKEAAAVQ